jgi:Soluble lytic murein transglycosylase and related regulatory proteins (some contain LysM/invasin domains)
MDNVTQEKNPIVLESQDNILKQNTSAAPQDTFKDLVKSVIWQESRGNKDAVSEKGAKGWMQIMPATAKEIANKLGEKNYDLHDPATNIRFGSYYLKNMLDAFDGDVKLALAAYNFGIGRVKKLLTQNNADSYEQIESLLPQETRQYVPAILKRLNTKIDIVKV